MFYTNRDPFGLDTSGFSGFPGSPFYSSYSPYDQRQRQEIARQNRMAQMERERRTRAEFERRKRMELQREEMRRCLEEESLRRQLGFEGAGGAQYCGRPKPHHDASSYPPGTIVRGPDGRLYKIVAPPDNERNDEAKRRLSNDASSASSASSQSDAESLISEVEDDSTEGESVANFKHVISGEKTEIPIKTSDKTSNKSEFQVIGKRISTQMSDLSEQSPTLHMVSVEEVSDDEDEEIRDLHSVWRNRMPSPGQWMEPIESFDK